MGLNQKQREWCLAQFEKVVTSRGLCRACNHDEFAMADIFLLGVGEPPAGDISPGLSIEILPMVPLSCKRCGLTDFYSARVLGLMNAKGEFLGPK